MMESTLFCAALPIIYYKSIEVTSLITLQSMTQRGMKVPDSLYMNYNLTGLMPSTDYDVYCFTRIANGRTTDLDSVISSKIHVKTDGKAS